MDILLVDGYNIIGAWPELNSLKKKELSAARDRLVEIMAEYQAYTGYRVIIVFDAYFVSGTQKKYQNYKVEVMFTKESETADERIEKLAITLNNRKTQVHVATSDYTEQWAIFGQGALRKSARELLTETNLIEKKIEKRSGGKGKGNDMGGRREDMGKREGEGVNDGGEGEWGGCLCGTWVSYPAPVPRTSRPTPVARALRSVITPCDVEMMAMPRPFITRGMSSLLL